MTGFYYSVCVFCTTETIGPYTGRSHDNDNKTYRFGLHDKTYFFNGHELINHSKEVPTQTV